MQENLQRYDDELVELENLPAFTSSATSSLQHPDLAVANGYIVRERNEPSSLHFEKQLFADMRSTGFSLLLQLVEAADGIELLKTMVLELEYEMLKYHSQEAASTELRKPDVQGAIDALETVTFLNDLRQIHLKKQRLKRRLAEWSPPAYLIINWLSRLLEDQSYPVDTLLAGRLKKTIRQYHSHRNRMAHANLRLVYSVAQRFRHLGLPFEDLVQEGNLGLIKAIERFDISKGFRFSTYAHIVISQSIHLALDKQLGLVRLPFKALREKAAVEKVRHSLEQSLGRMPHIHELEEHLPDDLEYKRTHIANVIEPNANSQLLYSQPDDAELVSGFTLQEHDQQTSSMKHDELVQTMLDRLNERESYIVRMRYGIGLNKEFTLEEISQTMGLSRERVRQLANQAVEKLGRLYQVV